MAIVQKPVWVCDRCGKVVCSDMEGMRQFVDVEACGVCGGDACMGCREMIAVTRVGVSRKLITSRMVVCKNCIEKVEIVVKNHFVDWIKSIAAK